jgi:hypothetical protein
MAYADEVITLRFSPIVRQADSLALRDAGFIVVTDIRSVPWEPDVIQANQTYPLIEAFARFPNVPILSICHDAKIWHSEPVNLRMCLLEKIDDKQIGQRLDDRFRLLTGGQHTALPRHQTMHATLEWSHEKRPRIHGQTRPTRYGGKFSASRMRQMFGEFFSSRYRDTRRRGLILESSKG